MINGAQVTPLTFEAVRSLAIKALASGGERLSPHAIAWAISGNCTDPATREVWARPHRAAGRRGSVHVGREIIGDVVRDRVIPGRGRIEEDRYVLGGRFTRPTHLAVVITARCRKCENCLRLRSLQWQERASAEFDLSRRTWFGTITFNETARVRARYRAVIVARKSGQDFDALSYGEQFSRLVNACSPHVTKWLKRVRKRCGTAVRYLLVAEHHKDGFPHFHILVHEAADAITYRDLTETWVLGFTQFKLLAVEEKRAVRYVAKYLSKTSVARVRASLGYGNGLQAQTRQQTKCEIPSPIPLTDVKMGTDHRKENVALDISSTEPPAAWASKAARLSTAATASAPRRAETRDRPTENRPASAAAKAGVGPAQASEQPFRDAARTIRQYSTRNFDRGRNAVAD